MSHLKPVNPVRILFRDYWSDTFVRMALGAWGLIAFFYAWGYIRKLSVREDIVIGLVWIAIITSLFALVFAILRISRIHKIIKHGVEITGRLIEVPSMAGRHAYHVSCEFEISGKKKTVDITIEQKRILGWNLKKGDEINLVVDSSNPRRVLIRNLFCL